MVGDLDFIDEDYRDALGTVDSDGKRIWVYPKKPKGPYYNRRLLVTFLVLLVFFSVPFIKIGGAPLLQIDVLDRKFYIFGQLFLPQDFLIFSIGLITFFVFITLFTVIYGRIWCGWLCPQTIFMEMVFRPIEYWIDGDRKQQIKLKESPWNSQKIFKRSLKYFIYLVISSVIAHIALAYFIGIERVQDLISQGPSENLSGFIALVLFTGIFFFVFTRLREQVCIAICPYGRLQGVLVTRNTMTIIYDYLRGEPRKKLSKDKVDDKNGDCIDCKLCVQVCPTNIDIRNGTQLECVNCTACIDACDEVMEKIHKPKGLIRYSSLESIQDKKPFKISRRAWFYTLILVALIGIETTLLTTRSPVDVTVMRVPGKLYQEMPDNKLSNLYNAQFSNKSNKEMRLKLKVEDFPATIKFAGNNQEIVIGPGERAETVFFIEINKDDIKNRKTKLEIEVLDNDKKVKSVSTNFLGYVNE